MKKALIAAGLSLALHAVGVFLLLREAAPSVVPVAAPAREKPVEMEVLRLAGIVSPTAKPAPERKRPSGAVAKPPPFIPSGVEGPDDDGAGRADAGASLDSARDERGEGSARDERGEGSARDERGEGSAQGLRGEGPAQGLRGEGSAQGLRGEGSAREDRGAPLDTTALSRRLQQVALRCYPAAARRFRQTGEAEVRFCLDAAGALREKTIVRTSGSELLDHAANDCVVPGAAPFGPETFGRCFTVPVRFSP